MNLNDKILLATQVNGRWAIQEDTYKGNVPVGYQVVNPQQAQQYIQQNIDSVNAQVAQRRAGGADSPFAPAAIANYQKEMAKYANYTPPASSGQQYTYGPNGQLMTTESAKNYVAQGTITSNLTQAQLTAQNAQRGISQFNPASAPVQPLASAVIPQGTAGAVQPTSYTVQAGDTLGAIAGKLGVPVSQLTGYRSGNPNLIYPGENITVKGQTSEAKPVTLLSSKTGADTVTDNKTKLEAIQNVVNSFSGSANTPEQQAALKTFQSSMKAEIDAATAQGGLTTDERAAGKKTQEARDALTTSAAKAQAALDSKDYSSMDYWTNKAQADRQRYETELADYYEKTKDLRAQLTAKMTPSEKEQELNRQVNDIKTEIQQRNLQLQKDKMAEYEGTTLQFGQGRAAELSFKESFAQQELALKQANLLSELGLEQSAREMQSQSIEQQLSYLADDFNLQQQVSERIAASEEAVFQRADTLQKEAKNTLVTLLDGLQGVNPSEMSRESLAQLETLAARSNVPYDLILSALQVQNQRVSFDQALQAAQETRLSSPSGTSTGGVGTDQLYSGLSSQTSTAVRSKVGKFSTEPLIQNFATIQDGYNFASSLSDTTKNPADDQALIYSLAKALDPGSVVREGEYATAQKYAQSWIQAYGKGVEQALAGTGFLSETARKNIKATIKQKYASSKKSYDQIVKSYETGINSLTGRGDGSQFLTDYVTQAESAKYEPGTTFANDGILYLVGDDGETITPIANYAG